MEGSRKVVGRCEAWDREEEGRERWLADPFTAGARELQTGEPAGVCSKRADNEFGVLGEATAAGELVSGLPETCCR
jgi:hypothetical protein